MLPPVLRRDGGQDDAAARSPLLSLRDGVRGAAAALPSHLRRAGGRDGTAACFPPLPQRDSIRDGATALTSRQECGGGRDGATASLASPLRVCGRDGAGRRFPWSWGATGAGTAR